MKSSVILAAICLFMVAFAGQVKAQGIKVGYANVDYILSQLPDSKVVNTQLEEYQKQLGSQLQAKYATLEAKAGEYEAMRGTMTPDARAKAEEELRTLQEGFQQFQADAEQSLQKKRVELLSPVYDKIQASIDKVAAAEGFAFILRSSSLLFASEANENISNKVLADLGVEVKEEGEE